MFIVSSIREMDQSDHCEKNINKSGFYLGQFVGVILSLGFCVIYDFFSADEIPFEGPSHFLG